jgi:hypothetical protein
MNELKPQQVLSGVARIEESRPEDARTVAAGAPAP